jgi:hypothetical protein
VIDADSIIIDLPPGGQWFATRRHRVRLRAELCPQKTTYVDVSGFPVAFDSLHLTGIGAFEIRNCGVVLREYRRTDQMLYGPFFVLESRPSEMRDA